MRYADDCIIFVKSEMSANRVMKSVTSWLERKLFLKVSAEKTKVFLSRRHAVSRHLSIKFTNVDQIVKGWINYFGIGSIETFLEEFVQWLCHKI